LTKKTRLKTPFHGKEIIPTKPRLKNDYDFFGSVYCFIVLLFVCLVTPALHNIFHTTMVLYSPFVLKLPLNTKKLSRRPPQYTPAPCKLTFDLSTLKVVSESRVTWATSVPILVFLGLSVLDLGPMYTTDRRQTSERRQTCIIA